MNLEIAGRTNELGNEIKRLRKSLGRTQAQLAELIGVEKGSGAPLVARWESGVTIPGTDRLEALARLFPHDEGLLAKLVELRLLALQARYAPKTSPEDHASLIVGTELKSEAPRSPGADTSPVQPVDPSRRVLFHKLNAQELGFRLRPGSEPKVRDAFRAGSYVYLAKSAIGILVPDLPTHTANPTMPIVVELAPHGITRVLQLTYHNDSKVDGAPGATSTSHASGPRDARGTRNEYRIYLGPAAKMQGFVSQTTLTHGQEPQEFLAVRRAADQHGARLVFRTFSGETDRGRQIAGLISAWGRRDAIQTYSEQGVREWFQAQPSGGSPELTETARVDDCPALGELMAWKHLDVLEKAPVFAPGGSTESPVQLRGDDRLASEFLKSAFQHIVTAAYGYQCAIGGERLTVGSGWYTNLEAVPIVPIEDGGTYSPRNGLLLSPELARLFREGLFTVDPDTKLIEVSPLAALNPRIAEFHGKLCRFPGLLGPHRDALLRHRARIFRSR